MKFEPFNSLHLNTGNGSPNGGYQASRSRVEPISVVIPTLNDVANISELLVRLHAALMKAGIPYEAIVVDDHSTDGTRIAAEAIARFYHLPVRVLIKRGRPGKSYSLIEG